MRRHLCQFCPLLSSFCRTFSPFFECLKNLVSCIKMLRIPLSVTSVVICSSFSSSSKYLGLSELLGSVLISFSTDRLRLRLSEWLFSYWIFKFKWNLPFLSRDRDLRRSRDRFRSFLSRERDRLRSFFFFRFSFSSSSDWSTSENNIFEIIKMRSLSRYASSLIAPITKL